MYTSIHELQVLNRLDDRRKFNAAFTQIVIQLLGLVIKMNCQFKVVTFYEFKNIGSLADLSKLLKDYCRSKQLFGSIIIAAEGINGTLAGLPESIDELICYLKALNFYDLNAKYSKTAKMPFYRNKIKIKREIVTFLKKPIKTDNDRAFSIDPGEWNELITRPDVVTIDVRNDYETKIGSFENAVLPKMSSFVEFKKYIDEELAWDKKKKIAMYCTGGIRCEKASYYMKEIGFEEVYQLNGGILSYLENVSDDDSLWNGECFVFDNRVTVRGGLNRGSYDLCRGCNEPISHTDKISNKFENDVSCPNCYDESSEIKKASSRERAKQICLSKNRGTPNVYVPKPIEDYV